MPTNQEFEEERKERVKLTAKVEQLVGAVDVANQINIELVKLLKKALCYEFWVIVFLIAALVYGAIGKEGFYAVRGSVPLAPIAPVNQQQTPDGGSLTSIQFPWSDDLRHFKAQSNLPDGTVPQA